MLPVLFYGQNSIQNSEFELFNSAKIWKKEFVYKGNKDWKKKWFLDGEMATIINSKKGMHYSAGSVDKEDAHHAVLWTKDSFEGDLKIEFDYTRTDTLQKNVCILYIQATGIGKEPFHKDISKWKDLRKVPAMRTYFNHMNALHISFAAFTNKGEKYDYVRVRRYPTSETVSFNVTQVLPSYDNVGFFETGITYHITVLKKENKLFFLVKGEKESRLFSWDTSDFDPITEGRIGLRHMYTRSAIYKNFKIFTDGSSKK